ncbi:actin cytoskeleton component [Candida orthopsilosis Co 90-125]|uniref:Actin cytoskeleton component n=1 Tax=Candida orthopsilosis (strain 90-125) TaxID=1136231 RepID=H8WVY4_CANO9|nr:actin cytoskeleton component [Candida orthopsilosis Co 90-125]CCG20608.1 actin cytoskeleton component [Candida orthopsilosis Co 90-125]
MSIKPIAIAPPQPSTQRGQAAHLSYDAVNDRLAYVNGKSVIIRPADFNSNAPVVVFTKHIHPTTAVKFSPSGFYIASGDESGQIKIWDAAPKKGEGEFEQPIIKSEFQVMSGPIRSIAWDADNSRIIAVGQGKEKFGHAFSWDTGNSIGDIQGHSSTINAVDIKPQRPYRAATVSDDFALVFYQGPPFKFDKSLRGNHTNSVRDVKFSPDGEYIVSVGSDRAICIYQGKTGEFIKKIENGHDGGIFAVSWTSDSKKFVTASADGSVRTWKVDEGLVSTHKVAEKPTVFQQLVGLTVTKDYVIALSYGGDLTYFKNGEIVQVIQGHQAPITKLAISKSDLYSGSSDGKLFKFEIDPKGLKSNPTRQGGEGGEHSNYVVDLLLGDGGLYSIGWDDEIKQWKEGKVVTSAKLPSQPKQLNKVGDNILVLLESELQLFSKDLELVSMLKLDFSSTNAASLSSSRLLVTNASKNTIVSVEIDNGSKLSISSQEFPTLRTPPTLIKVSPDGEFFAVADSSGKYTLFKNDGSVVSTRWAFHTSKAYDAQWSPDSKYLVSGGLDCGLLLYSVEKPSKVVKFPLAHASGVTSLAWVYYDSEKQTGQFVSSGLDGTIRQWELLR